MGSTPDAEKPFSPVDSQLSGGAEFLFVFQ